MNQRKNVTFVSSREHSVARSLIFFYIFGWALIAGLSVFSYSIFDSITSTQADVAKAVNIANRQGMLSQRIAMLASDIKNGDASATPLFSEAIRSMDDSRGTIVNGGISIDSLMAPTLRQVYLEAPIRLDGKVQDFLKTAQMFLGAPNNKAEKEKYYSDLQYAARTEMIPALNNAVLIFQTEANQRIDRLRNVRLAILVTIIITLLLEALFIFRPVFRKATAYADKLNGIATKDVLTGLTNRRYFLESAERDLLIARRSQSTLGVIMIDIDQFKKVNDVFGHAVGDAVLRRLSDVALRTLRKSDLISRLGGEEFVVLLHGGDVSSATAVAEKLRTAIADKQFNDLPPITISAGVAMLQPQDETIDAVMQRADLALYQSKSDGRNRVSLG